MEIIILNKYKIGKLLGEGSFGKIFEGVNISTEEKVAVKIEKKTDKSLLKHEANYSACDFLAFLSLYISHKAPPTQY